MFRTASGSSRKMAAEDVSKKIYFYFFFVSTFVSYKGASFEPLAAQLEGPRGVARLKLSSNAKC